SGQQSLQGASGASVGSTVGTGAELCVWVDVPGVATGELHAASRTATRANDSMCGAPFLIRSDCSVRWAALLDANPRIRIGGALPQPVATSSRYGATR